MRANSKNPKLFLGYSFQDHHINYAFNVESSLKPISYISGDNYASQDTFVNWLINSSIEKKEEFYIENFLENTKVKNREIYDSLPPSEIKLSDFLG